MTNFLFVMTDQLRADHTGFGGNPIVQTPNIDRLAAEAHVFERAYCPSPLCGPSRSSIFTGRVPSAHGNWLNTLALGWDANTFVRVLRTNGYSTTLIGKSHFQEFLSRREVAEGKPNQPVDMPRPGPHTLVQGRHPYPGNGRATEPGWPAGWNSWEDVVRHRDAYLQLPDDFYGFDTVELCCTHADLPEGHYRHWFSDRGGDPDRMGGIDHALRVDDSWQQVYLTNVPEELYTTSFITDRALDSLDRMAAQQQPFFLNVSYPDPHHPFCPPEPYFSMYDGADIDLPANFHDDHAESMPHLRRTIESRGADYVGPFLMSPSAEQYRAAIGPQYGSITMIDDGIGRIIDRLDELGLVDDTVIIFTADHGDMFGDHGLLLKFGAHYDPLVRVPFFVSLPGDAGGTSDALMSLIDLAPTVLELAGCEPYVGMQGRSVLAQLVDGDADQRDSVYVEEDLPFDILGNGQNTSIRTLITSDARLTTYSGATEGELFDLAEDPTEMHNLHADPSAAPLRSTMLAELVDTMTTHRNIERFE